MQELSPIIETGGVGAVVALVTWAIVYFHNKTRQNGSNSTSIQLKILEREFSNLKGIMERGFDSVVAELRDLRNYLTTRQ